MREVTLVWPGGEHVFALRIGELEALQKASDSGPGEVLGRLYKSMSDSPLIGVWRISDICDTIRLGLIGGGMEQLEARELVRKTIDRVGMVELIATAADILAVSLAPDEDAPGKQKGTKVPPKK